MTIPVGLPERLVEIREQNGYTRKRLAEELGRPYRTLTNYEMGEREPGHTYIIEIAKKFGVTTDYLLGLSDDPHKTSDEAKKESPSMTEAAPGDEVSRIFDILNNMLVSAGLIEDGADITAKQSEVLVAICRIIDATFND